MSSAASDVYKRQTLAYDVLKIIEDSKIQALIITDKNKTIKGLIHLHKLVESGISN